MADLHSRVKAEIKRLHHEGKFTQAALARRLGVDASAAHGYVNGTTRTSLEVLEAVSELTGIPLAELVVPAGSLIRQLNPTEAAIFRYLRQWPADVVESLFSFLTFFADEPLADLQSRNLHAIWRRLTRTDRDWLYAVAVLLREGNVQPDLRAGLVDRLTTERQRPKDERAKQTPKERRDE